MGFSAPDATESTSDIRELTAVKRILRSKKHKDVQLVRNNIEAGQNMVMKKVDLGRKIGS